MILDGFFKYMFHVGYAINLHSIINSGLIFGGQILSKKQTVFITSVDLVNKEHRDPNNIGLEAPRLAWYMHKAWKKHQNTVYRVDIKLAQKKGLKFYEMRSNAIILHDTLPAYCIPKVRMETGEIIYEKIYVSPRPPKICSKDSWMKQLGQKLLDKQKTPTNQRRDPLWLDNQSVRLQRSTRWTSTSEYLDCHIQL